MESNTTLNGESNVKKQLKAFTLIELLVVIAIIAILAAILFPVFAKARDRAKLSACINNEKQIGLACMTYTDDYDGIYPINRRAVPGGLWTWKRAIYPYVKSYDVFKCPSVINYWAINPETGAKGDESNSLPQYRNKPNEWMPCSYGYSGGFFFETGGSATPRPRRISEVKDPAGTLFILNTRMSYPDLGPWMISYRCDLKGNNAPNSKLGAFVAHNGRIPMIMADGHVKALKMAETVLPNDMWKHRSYSQTALVNLLKQMPDEYK
jgi:prepilin-type N-terminal cleavage/methylation domain-containing protein/prepilin-type processing-associated H-X9-DG protein